MISKTKSERKTTIKISRKRDNGLAWKAMMDDRSKTYICDKVLASGGIEELTDEVLETRIRKSSSAMEVTVQ